MNGTKEMALIAAENAYAFLRATSCIDELTVTGPQLLEYHEKVIKKYVDMTTDVIKKKDVYNTMIDSFAELEDRHNLVTESFVKEYCNHFVDFLRIEKRKHMQKSS
jgi:hypothetical protein